jgi:hypothetical protein
MPDLLGRPGATSLGSGSTIVERALAAGGDKNIALDPALVREWAKKSPGFARKAIMGRVGRAGNI